MGNLTLLAKILRLKDREITAPIQTTRYGTPPLGQVMWSRTLGQNLRIFLSATRF